jgi:hypothetical protein
MGKTIRNYDEYDNYKFNKVKKKKIKTLLNNKKIDKRELYPDDGTDRDSYQDDERDYK